MVGLLSTLVGCTTGNPSIKDPGRTTQIKLGETTKVEVRTILGKPGHVAAIKMFGQDQEMWHYSCNRDSSFFRDTVTTFILPLVVSAAAGAAGGAATAVAGAVPGLAAGSVAKGVGDAAIPDPSPASATRGLYQFMLIFGPDGTVRSIFETTPSH
jgi:hypothetical protein